MSEKQNDNNQKAENKYIKKRLQRARLQSIPFYLCRILPIRKNKIVFCCIEGTTGYTCNPKYIAEELLANDRYQETGKSCLELVWLVNDMEKEVPEKIHKVKNSLWNRAYHLSTAGFWIDNSRKQLEARKRKGQIYIQTWHAQLAFKPTCLDRGPSFPRIAYLVSKHDSDMVDYWLSNSDWYDRTLETGSLYKGKTLRTGSPRCDILVKASQSEDFKREVKRKLLKLHNEEIKDVMQKDIAGTVEDIAALEQIHFLMYAPTFRGGSQSTERSVEVGENFPDYERLKNAMEKRFGGQWIILFRLHPQLVARHLDGGMENSFIWDVSRVDDMYELLAGCEAFVTDYSSAAFDAAVMKIPIFLYAYDYEDYEKERGKLLWDLHKLPFPLAMNDGELEERIHTFNEKLYRQELEALFTQTGMEEKGDAAEKVREFIYEKGRKNRKKLGRR